MPIYKSRQDIRHFGTHLEEETEINSMRTWGYRLLFKISRKYTLNKLSKVCCNSGPEKLSLQTGIA